MISQSPDIFLARYNADGTLAWARGVGAAEWDQGCGVAALSDGSVLVTGSFCETVIFGAGEANETILTAVANGDVFVARYDAGGALACTASCRSRKVPPSPMCWLGPSRFLR